MNKSHIHIGIVGYGKMGQMVHKLASEQQITTHIISPSKINWDELKALIQPCDVLIEFTHPLVAQKIVDTALNHKKTIISGTTGWTINENDLHKKAQENQVGILHASNFSIGFHIYNQLIAKAARFFHKAGQYDVAGHEIHHQQKADSPSGTAKVLAQTVIDHFPSKTQALFDTSHEKIDPQALHFTSSRVGSIPGTHSIFFDSTADSIELTHRARSREGFAQGALTAALWLHGKTGLFTMNDLMKEVCL